MWRDNFSYDLPVKQVKFGSIREEVEKKIQGLNTMDDLIRKKYIFDFPECEKLERRQKHVKRERTTNVYGKGLVAL